jgi:hypothetical protein
MRDFMLSHPPAGLIDYHSYGTIIYPSLPRVVSARDIELWHVVEPEMARRMLAVNGRLCATPGTDRSYKVGDLPDPSLCGMLGQLFNWTRDRFGRELERRRLPGRSYAVAGQRAAARLRSLPGLHESSPDPERLPLQPRSERCAAGLRGDAVLGRQSGIEPGNPGEPIPAFRCRESRQRHRRALRDTGDRARGGLVRRSGPALSRLRERHQLRCLHERPELDHHAHLRRPRGRVLPGRCAARVEGVAPRRKAGVHQRTMRSLDTLRLPRLLVALRRDGVARRRPASGAVASDEILHALAGHLVAGHPRLDRGGAGRGRWGYASETRRGPAAARTAVAL